MGRLFWKFFLAFWLALLLAGIGVGTTVWLRHQVEAGNDATGGTHHPEIDIIHAAAMLQVAEQAHQYGGILELRRFLDKLRASHVPPVYAVDDEDHEILERNLAAETLQQARSLYLEGNNPDAFRILSASDGHRYLLFVPMPNHDRPNSGQMGHDLPGPEMPGPGMFDHDMPDHPPQNDFNRDAHQKFAHRPPGPPSPLLPILSGIVASLVFSFALAWYFAKPIRQLRLAIASLAAGNLKVRVADAMGKRRDELSALGHDFDRMAEKIYSLLNAQQRLLHDVSHELRSPLARIQAAIGLVQQQPDKLQTSLVRIEREAQRISDLVGELLVLSRLEAGISGGDKQEFDLGALLDDIVADVRFEAELRQVHICAEGTEEIMVTAWGELLHRAIENVLRNAVQHCKAGGEVCLKSNFDSKSRCWRLLIEDQGSGVPEQDLTEIFQPFYRSHSSKKPDGIGLGLAIAQQALLVHEGKIKATNRPEGGLQVAMEIVFA
ncbi:ATP-binding protein [Methylomonas sp. AM2-LC]|uniref:sensor histidine kinase n=1 Tax=Methylomonas sp. AM2-LC TaxID=3153301 RepID=UPI003263F5BA